MVDYSTDRNGDRVVVERRGGAGRTLGIIAVIAIVVVALLFLTGFWKADVKNGALPDVDISAKGGALPNVDLDSKKVVVGTKETTVEVPKVKTEKETVSVPVVGVKDNGEK
jgi:hypothetical protein